MWHLDHVERFIPIASLVIAALAVFFGPLISLAIAKGQIRESARLAEIQIRSSLATANKQITSPMRQAWIDKLRDLMAEFVSKTLHYYVSGHEDRSDKEYERLTLLHQKIRLMLNMNEDDHRRLDALVSRLINSLEGSPDLHRQFPEIHGEVVALSRAIFKREWNVVKEPVAFGKNGA